MGLPIPPHPFTYGSIVTNGTVKTVPYCADCILFLERRAEARLGRHAPQEYKTHSTKNFVTLSKAKGLRTDFTVNLQ